MSSLIPTSGFWSVSISFIYNHNGSDLVGTDFERGKLYYHLLILTANNVIQDKNLYWKNNQIIATYFQDVGIFSIDEAKNIVERLGYHFSHSKNEAKGAFQRFMPLIRIPYKELKTDDIAYISPCCCEKLYKSITPWTIKTLDGRAKVRKFFDFKDPQTIALYQSQKNDKNFTRVERTKDLQSVIQSNDFEYVKNMSYQSLVESNAPSAFAKVPSRPIGWETSIVYAVTKGKVSSIYYDIYVFPILLNLQGLKGNTPLHVAAFYGQIKSIDALIDCGANKKIFNDDQQFPIHLSKNVDTLEHLLGLYLADLEKDGISLLEGISKTFNVKTIKHLILKRGVDITKPNPKTNVFWAQYVIHNKLMEYDSFIKLLHKMAKKSSFQTNADAKEIKQITKIKKFFLNSASELKKAIEKNDINQVSLLLALGCIPDEITNLLLAVSKGNKEIVQMLLDNFCDPNIKNYNGENAYAISIQKGYFEISTLLLDYHADRNAKSKTGDTPLHVAYKNKNFELVRYLLQQKSNPNIPDSNRLTVQYMAFADKNLPLAEEIQDKHRGDINAQGKNGDTLALLAFYKRDFEFLHYLIERHIDTSICNDKGIDLFRAAFYSNIDPNELETIIKRTGVNTQDPSGSTVFLSVCKKDPFDKTKYNFLIAHKANASTQNKAKEFPVSFLIARGLDEEAKFLIEEKNVKIKDSQSPHEPIVIALKLKKKFWIDYLIEHEANFKNECFPVAQTYIDCYFDEEQFHKVRHETNYTIGSPLQSLMRLKQYFTASFAWDRLLIQEKVTASKSRDSEGKTPLVAALYHLSDNNLEDMIRSIILTDGADVETPDKYGKTPLILSIMKNIPVGLIYHLLVNVSLDNINHTDNDGNCAITIAANTNKRISDELFIQGADVKNAKLDKYNTIKHYRSLIMDYEKALEKIQEKYNYYQKCSKEQHEFACEKAYNINHLDSNATYIEQSNSIFKKDQAWSGSTLITFEKQALSASKSAAHDSDMKVIEYRGLLSQLKSMTRKDIIDKNGYLKSLAQE